MESDPFLRRVSFSLSTSTTDEFNSSRTPLLRSDSMALSWSTPSKAFKMLDPEETSVTTTWRASAGYLTHQITRLLETILGCYTIGIGMLVTAASIRPRESHSARPRTPLRWALLRQSRRTAASSSLQKVSEEETPFQSFPKLF